MKPLHILLFVSTCLCCSPAARASEEPSKPKSDKHKSASHEHGPGLLNTLWDKITFRSQPSAEKMAATTSVERQVGSRKLLLSMSLEPQPLKLSENRQLKVNLRVANQMKKLVQLEFPTTQRIEVLVRNASGAMVEQWSEDRSFENQPGIISVNPGEHLEYSATVSTRDMTAGETYTVEALFPQYEPLRLQKKVTPLK